MAGKTTALVDAGLAAMEAIGRPLSRMPSRGNAKLFQLPNGETVRLRTCSRRVLLVNAKHPDADAKLDIEGTDWLLIIFPKKERSESEPVCYLVPTSEAVREMRHAHRKWLAAMPNTKGQNTTWTLAFKELPAHDDYSAIWAKHRIN